MLTTLVFTMSCNIVPKYRLGEGLVFFAMSTSVGTPLEPLESLFAISYLANYTFQSMMMLTPGPIASSLVCCFLQKTQ
ncbi:hypothetical protein [Oceanobacillus polygoni]|uniref:hypothetical protein n=1 Tax=Oceanobacillus polygoni TaxID=1235259 RepID=UPI001AE72F47|nr:hypothetical protein [Oceanobacillus polygoni]